MSMVEKVGSIMLGVVVASAPILAVLAYRQFKHWRTKKSRVCKRCGWVYPEKKGKGRRRHESH